MNLRKFCAAVFALALTSMMAVAQTASGPNESSALTRDPATGAYKFSWWGQAGRTYFLQQSEDLMNWTYMPVIEPGAGQSIGWGFTSTASKFFLRLKYTDTTTTDPFNDDFDGDGVSNWDELMQGTDPFSAPMDTNGLPIDWEIRYFRHLDVDPNGDEDGDGLTNLQEFQLQTDPTDSYNSTVGLAGDSDHNGLADWWEILHFGHIGNDPNQVVAGKGGLILKQVFDGRLNFTASSTVGDGIPDSWKIAHGLDANSLTAMNEDPDGDRLTNAEEYEAGTNPMNWDTDGDYIPDGQDMAPLVANPVDPDNVRIDVPSYDTLSQQPKFDPSQVDYTSIQVQWDPADYGGTATGYRIEKRVDSNPWKELATVGAGTTSQADQGLIASRQYQYRVIALVDSANVHVESSGVFVYYQVPLKLHLDVKQSSLSREKSDWAWPEFTTRTLSPSSPPKYYLTDIINSSLDGANSYGLSNTSVGKFSHTRTNTPSQHTRSEAGTYDFDYNITSTDGTHGASGKHSGVNWTEQSRGKGQTSSHVFGNEFETTTSSEMGGNRDWSGTYQSSVSYQANQGLSLWTGQDFDLAKGKLTYSGHSTYHSHSDDRFGGNREAVGSSDQDATTGNWSGTLTDSYTDKYGTKTSNSEPTTSPWIHVLYGYTWAWMDDVISTTSTKQVRRRHYTSGNYHNNTDASEVRSQEYITSALITDVVNDLPDYPQDWNNNWYGWNNYNWGYRGWDGYSYGGGWYPYGYPWYGWWVAERHLSTDESRFAISKMKYKFTANPSAPTTTKWYEVFVPDDDPTTPDVDESKSIKIVAERTWTLGAGQNECPEYEIDPNTRNDGNGYYTLMIEPAHLSTPELGEAGKDVTGSDTDPGKVVLINDGDADDDGIPDYGDGYQLHDGIDNEAGSYSTSFTPAYISWAALDPQHAKIKFTYDASDPLGVTRSGSDFYVLPSSGKLRIWTKDGREERDGHDAKQGGNFIKSGVEYTLQDLGLDPNYYWHGGMTFYVEAVKISDSTADLPVKVEIDPTGTLGFPWSDQLRFTATKIELRGKQYSEQDFSPVNRLINSTLDQFNPVVQTYNTTPASYEVHRVRLYDPRATVITRVKIGSTYLPVTRNGTFSETGDFVCIQPGTTPANWQGGATLVPMAGTSFQIEYNPFSLVDWICGFRRSPDQAKYVQDVVDQITKDCHDDQSWIANYKIGDKGKLGTETDKRLATFFRNKPGWHTNVYVNKNTGEIFSTGVHLEPSELAPRSFMENVRELDVVYCKGGYVINTGPRAYSSGKVLQKLNKNGLLFASEVKTAARLEQNVINDIIADYKLITGLKEIYLADSPYAYKLSSNSVILNKVRARAGRMLGIAGGAFILSASIASAAVNVSEANATLDQTMQTVIRDRAVF